MAKGDMPNAVAGSGFQNMPPGMGNTFGSQMGGRGLSMGDGAMPGQGSFSQSTAYNGGNLPGSGATNSSQSPSFQDFVRNPNAGPMPPGLMQGGINPGMGNLFKLFQLFSGNMGRGMGGGMQSPVGQNTQGAFQSPTQPTQGPVRTAPLTPNSRQM